MLATITLPLSPKFTPAVIFRDKYFSTNEVNRFVANLSINREDGFSARLSNNKMVTGYINGSTIRFVVAHPPEDGEDINVDFFSLIASLVSRMAPITTVQVDAGYEGANFKASLQSLY